MDNKDKQIRWIDPFKGIAMIGVALVHSGGSNMPGVLGKIGRSGLFGVQLFFMISAFLAWHSLERFHGSYLDWIKKKYIRLMPVYYVAMVLAIIVGRIDSIGNISVHIAGLWGMFPHYNNTVVPAEWYLGALLLFYLMAPFLYRFVNSLGSALIFYVVLQIIVSGTQYIICMLIPSISEDYSLYAYVINTSLWAQLPTICLGIVFYYGLLFIETREKDLNESKMRAYALLIISLIWIAGGVLQESSLWGTSQYVYFTLGFMGIVISQILTRITLIINPIFGTIGRHSYGIYLFHYFVIRAIDGLIHIESELVTICIKLVGSIVVSMFISIGIDRVYRLISKKYGKK